MLLKQIFIIVPYFLLLVNKKAVTITLTINNMRYNINTANVNRKLTTQS